MTIRTQPSSLPRTNADAYRPAHAHVERIADAVVRTPHIDKAVVRFLARRVAEHFTMPVDEIERRLAVRIAHRVAVRDTARLLRSA